MISQVNLSARGGKSLRGDCAVIGQVVGTYPRRCGGDAFAIPFKGKVDGVLIPSNTSCHPLDIDFTNMGGTYRGNMQISRFRGVMSAFCFSGCIIR